MKKFEYVLQDGPKDCGVCALLTIIKCHGGLVSKEYLRTLTNTTSNGVSALSLLEAGKKLGFYTQGVSGDVLKLEERNLPCIAHVILDNKYKHFVVIHKIDRKKDIITIADPSRGIIKMDIDKFKTISTNNYLLFTPNRTIPIMRENDLIKHKIKNFIYDNKNTFYVILFLSILFTLINIIISFNFQFLIDRVIAYSSYNNLFVLSLIFFTIYALKNIIEFSREKILYFISHKLDYILVNDSLNHILTLPHIYFKNRTTGEILSRIADLGELKETICDFVSTVFIDLIITIVTFFALINISSSLSFIVLSIIVVYSILMIFYNRYLNDDLKELKEENAKVNSIIIELINGINTIKSLNILSKITEEYSLIYNKYLNVSFNFTKKINNKQTLDNLVVSLVSLIILVMGGSLVIKNELKLSSLITFNSIIFYNMSSLKNILNFDVLIQKTKITISRINELLNIKEEKLYLDLNPIKNVKGDIIIKDLSFKHGDRYILNNFSATFKEGKKILITGSSGCGKSTLAKLISGFHETRKGKIFIGKTDITDVNLWNLREDITYVSQDEYLFNNTLFENLNIRNARDKNKIIEIAKCMLLDDITSKNKSGYNMILEENARNISGGERQRIILARTFLKNSNIYILDETFSEIDRKKERLILNNIFKQFKDKTIIVISHRLDNSDLYDEVYNMEDYGYRSISKEL